MTLHNAASFFCYFKMPHTFKALKLPFFRLPRVQQTYFQFQAANGALDIGNLAQTYP